jgi:hypothetical protein
LPNPTWSVVADLDRVVGRQNVICVVRCSARPGTSPHEWRLDVPWRDVTSSSGRVAAPACVLTASLLRTFQLFFLPIYSRPKGSMASKQSRIAGAESNRTKSLLMAGKPLITSHAHARHSSPPAQGLSSPAFRAHHQAFSYIVPATYVLVL